MLSPLPPASLSSRPGHTVYPTGLVTLVFTKFPDGCSGVHLAIIIRTTVLGQLHRCYGNVGEGGVSPQVVGAQVNGSRDS